LIEAARAADPGGGGDGGMTAPDNTATRRARKAAQISCGIGRRGARK
jgi:hypothetical protein